MTKTGYEAYKTFLGMALHFRRAGYNGWDYNFNGKVKPETYEANRTLVYRFSALETKYPSKNEQIKLLYPVFKKHGYVNATHVHLVYKAHKEFMKELDEQVERYYEELENIASRVNNIDELMGLYENLPVLYNGYIEKVISYESLVILSLAIPSINKICSSEPFLWNSLLEKLQFDSKFYKLYLNIENIKQNTIETLMSTWKLQKGN